MPIDLNIILQSLCYHFLLSFQSSNQPSNRSSKEPASDNTPPATTIQAWVVPAVLSGLFLLWLLSGLFIIQPASTAAILPFGKYVETLEPGLHWIPRLIETKYVINEQKISSYSYEAQMLTKDENIVSVAIAVQYRIGSAKDYLFNVVLPQESLRQATASALRQVIGHMNLDEVLTSGREQIRTHVQALLSSMMQSYQTGLIITDVSIQPAKAPEEVKEAFDDAIKAQEDEQRIVNQAEAYAMQVEPIAKGQAQRLITDAKAYKQQIVLRAEGNTTRFLAILPQYQKSPHLIKTRLYYDTIENILSHNTKIFLDTASSTQMIYLPLDKLNTPFSVMPAATTTATAFPASGISQATTSGGSQ